MISVKKKFLFIHIPKTGGNSIQTVLKDYSEDKIVVRGKQDGIDSFAVENRKYKTRKHSTLSHYKTVLEPGLYDGLFKFAVIRNPWDRMVSLYFSSRNKTEKEWNREDFLRLINKAFPIRRFIVADSFAEKVLNKLQLRGELCGEPSYCKNTEYFLRKLKVPIDSVRMKNKNIDCDIDFLIKFENLNEDIEFICNKLSIPYTPLPVRNKSQHNHYSNYYDNELKNIVERKFAEEIEFGKYEFEKA